MSLINEALKKAQHQRASADPVLPPQPGTPVPPRQPPRRRSLLWGFLMAVLVVGVFSAVTTTFLVYQILGPGEAAQPAHEPVPLPAAVQAVVAEAAPAPIQQPAPEPQPEPAPEAAPAPAPEPEAFAAIPPQEDATPMPLPAAPAVARKAPAAPPAETAAVEAPPQPPPAAPAFFPPPVPVIVNPAVQARIEELEIRGVLNSGERAKVLILDTTTGRTRSYKVGDLLQGPMSLRVAAINPNEIAFEDYGGAIHTKPF